MICPPLIKSLMATFLLNMRAVDGFSAVLTISPAKADILFWCTASAQGHCVEEPKETQR